MTTTRLALALRLIVIGCLIRPAAAFGGPGPDHIEQAARRLQSEWSEVFYLAPRQTKTARYQDLLMGNNGMLESLNTGEMEQRQYAQAQHSNTPTFQHSSEVVEQIELRVKYAGYIAQEEKAAQRAKGQEDVKIPAWIDYWKVPSLRYECREKLSKVKPENLGQASRLSGINPPDVAVLAMMIKRGHN